MPSDRIPIVFAGALVALCAASAGAEEPRVIRGAALHDQGVVPADVRTDMERVPPPRDWRPGDPIREMPQRKGLPRDFEAPPIAPQSGRDPLLQARTASAAAISGGPAYDTPLLNQDGAGFSGVNPPDPVGDVGNRYYVQMVNGIGGALVRVLDKTDGAFVDSFRLDDLAMGSGTGCTAGAGDPIVLFDHAAPNADGPPGRWFLSEFTSSSLCVYISQTADPTAGTWYLYEFVSDSGGLPDYPKYGVWPDAYYVGANEDGDSVGGAGRMVYALDRESMIQGLSTRPTQVFEAPLIDGFAFQLLHPVDWDGDRAPPDGAPGLFVRHRDDEVHDAGSNDPTRDFLELWRFSVAWDDPSDSTLTGPELIEVAEFESEMCGLTSFACVPQPGTATLLDPLREPMMWRVQYRNFGSHETLVGSWVSDVAGGSADLHGVRWAELREAGAGWSVHQQGTISPDSVHRFMSSIAMDRDGNIAAGYNVSDGTAVYPGLRYVGRRAADPPGTLPLAEIELVEGSAANGSNRYGDYSSMNVDPVDECTFWFTGEYNPTSQWRTRVGKFRLPDCGRPSLTLVGAPTTLEACTAPGSDVLPPVALEVGRRGGIDEFVFAGGFESLAVALGFSPPLPVGLQGSIVPNAVVPLDDPASAVVGLEATAGLAPGLQLVNVTASALDYPSTALLLELDVADAVPVAPALLSPADGATDVDGSPLFDWAAVPQADEYVFELAADAAFSSIVATDVVTETEFRPDQELASLTDYHWRVTARNQCGPGATAAAAFTTANAPGACPPGTEATVHFADDGESGAGDWTHSAAQGPDSWTLVAGDASSPVAAWRAAAPAAVSDQRLVSPAVAIPADAVAPVLRFATDFDLEPDGAGCFDGGLVAYSLDDGASWTVFDETRVLDNPYAGVIESGRFGNPLAGEAVWCGRRAWSRTVIDLDGLQGQTVRFRFRLATDAYVGADGWLIDDVTVLSCD